MEKTKTNKKNKSSIVVLLVAILLCVAIVFSLSGVTLAKYISSKEVSTQTANVAKWGYVLSVDSSKLFGEAYENSGATNQTVIEYSDSKDSDGTAKASVGVQATADTNNSTKGYSDVVAPGTEGYVTFSITGIAEVRSAITIATDSAMKASDTNSFSTEATTVALAKTTTTTAEDGTTSNSYSNIYEPIKWTLWTGTENSGEVTYTENENAKGMTYSEMITALGALSVADIAPNTTQNLYYKLSWAWAFDENADSTNSNSLYDTILGAFMAADTYKDYNADKPYEFTSGSGDYVGTQVRIYTSGSDLVVQSLAKDKDWTTNSDEIVTYTATTSVSLGLTVSVAQIQGTAATNNEETEDTDNEGGGSGTEGSNEGGGSGTEENS